MAEVVITGDESTEAGAFRALKAERKLHRETERKYHHLGQSLAARVEKLEQRGLTPVLDAMAEWRRDQSAEVAQVRAEVREPADAVDQLRSLIAHP